MKISESFTVVLGWQSIHSAFSEEFKSYIGEVIKSIESFDINNITNVNNTIQFEGKIEGFSIRLSVTNYPAIIMEFSTYDDSLYKAIDLIKREVEKATYHKLDIAEITYTAVFKISQDSMKFIEDNIKSNIFTNFKPHSIRFYNQGQDSFELLSIEPSIVTNNVITVSYSIKKINSIDDVLEKVKKQVEELVEFFEKM